MDTNSILGVIKQDEPQEGDVYTCTHPSVMNGTMFCDGNCWMCGYHQKLEKFVIKKVMEQKPIQRKPTDEEIREKRGWEHSRLSDYSVKIFKGRDLFETEPNYLGDYKHVSFFDKSVKDKIDKDKYYKCWYTYSDASDPADSSEYFYFVYVEEVPQDIVDAILAQSKIEKYLREK